MSDLMAKKCKRLQERNINATIFKGTLTFNSDFWLGNIWNAFGYEINIEIISNYVTAYISC